MVTVRKSVRIAFLAFAPLQLLPGCARTIATSQVRGELVWSQERQTLTECATGRVYRVRADASTPYVRFAEAVEKASLGLPPGGRLIADLEGVTESATPSSSTYPVDATLQVFVTHSVEVGTCD